MHFRYFSEKHFLLALKRIKYHIIVSTLIIISVIFFSLFRFINTSDDAYNSRIKEAKQLINKKVLTTVPNSSNTLIVGYGKLNITPLKKTKLVGYGLRDNFEGVHDSLFVRAISIRNSVETTIILSFDLLLVTPTLKQKIVEGTRKIGIKNIYFSATHSHSSFGGYGKGLLSDFALANYDSEIVNRIVNQSLTAIKSSLKSTDTISSINYQKIKSNKSTNRITDDKEIEDVLRIINFKTKNKKMCNIYSSNSHSTIVGRSNSMLSNDYPGLLMKNDTTIFSMFLAGTMGSLSPVVPTGIDYFEKLKYFENVLISGTPSEKRIKGKSVSFEKFELGDFSKTFIINSFIEIRPWVFDLLIGESSNNIETLKIGNLLMISLPCELSYEYYNDLERQANDKGLKLMITTFNGSYLGYCTPSKYYEIDNMETREMNWMGKYGGDYFNEVVKMIIEKQ